MPKKNEFRRAMTAEDIERLQSGAMKLSPLQIGRQKTQGGQNRYSVGYRPSRKTILGSNGSTF